MSGHLTGISSMAKRLLLGALKTLVGAVAACSARAAEARSALDFMGAPAADEIRRRHGMRRADMSDSAFWSTLLFSQLLLERYP
jgi:hypothetical protein